MGIQQILLANTVGVFTPVTHTFNSGSGVETVPFGATNVTIKVGGAGCGGSTAITNGGGGGGGGLAESDNIACSGTQTLNYSVGVGGVGGNGSGANVGNPGGNSTVTSGTLTVATMTGGGAPAQSTPFVAGAGGTASGGTTSNTSGAAGQTGAAGGAGGAAAGGFPGNGGAGQQNPSNGNTGSDGRITFAYT